MMDRMDDLIAFLRARLDEDEEIARAAGAGPGPAWRYDADGGWVRATREDDGIATGHQEYLDLEHGQHIARHDPARVLAEVDAKRRILDEVVPEMDGMTDQIHGEWGVGLIDPSTYESLGLLRLLALPYADHPDYRDAWRP